MGFCWSSYNCQSTNREIDVTELTEESLKEVIESFKKNHPTHLAVLEPVQLIVGSMAMEVMTDNEKENINSLSRKERLNICERIIERIGVVNAAQC